MCFVCYQKCTALKSFLISHFLNYFLSERPPVEQTLVGDVSAACFYYTTCDKLLYYCSLKGVEAHTANKTHPQC